MAKAKVTATTQQTTNLELDTLVLAQLRVKLTRIEELRKELEALNTEQEGLIGEIDNLLIDNGQIDAWQNGCNIDGYGIKNTEGERNAFDEKKFVLLGGDLAVYRAAFEKKPNKAYTRITTPREGKPRKK